MTTIGQALTAPESGWKRYDDTHPSFKNVGTWTRRTGQSGTYNSTDSYTSTVGNTISFRFVGSKIRLISMYWSSFSNDIVATIDGIDYHFSQYSASNITQAITFEKLDLTYGTHDISFKLNASGFLDIDAIDIESTGRLLHTDEVTDPKDLVVGKRIRAHYSAPTSGAVGTFSNLGQETYVNGGKDDFIPVAPSATTNGDFYFIMVEDWNGQKQLFTDRNLQTSISWDTLNTAGIPNGVSLGMNSTIPPMTTATTNNINITESAINGSDAGWKAFDGSIDTASRKYWYATTIPADSNGHWVKIEYPVEKKIVELSLRSFNIASASLSIKDFVVYGSNDDINYIELLRNTHPNTAVSGTNMGIEVKYAIPNNVSYKYYRINLLNSYYSNNNVGILEAQLYEQEDKNYSFITRLLTGGTSSTDKDNEWDNIIVNSTLGGLITAGDNNVWNTSNNLGSWTSTTQSGYSNKRAIRGYNSIAAYDTGTAGVAGTASTTVGFRPVLLIESTKKPPSINGITLDKTSIHKEDVILTGTITNDNKEFQYSISVNEQELVPLTNSTTDINLNQTITNNLLAIGSNNIIIYAKDVTNGFETTSMLTVTKTNQLPFGDFLMTPTTTHNGDIVIKGTVSNIDGGYSKDNTWNNAGEVFIKPIDLSQYE